MSELNFRPMGGYLAVAQPEEASAVNGVLLPSTVKNKEEYIAHEGRVLAVGPGPLLTNGDYAPTAVQEGDYVYWHPLAGAKVTMDGHKLLLLSIDDLFGTRPEEPELELAVPEVVAGG